MFRHLQATAFARQPYTACRPGSSATSRLCIMSVAACRRSDHAAAVFPRDVCSSGGEEWRVGGMSTSGCAAPSRAARGVASPAREDVPPSLRAYARVAPGAPSTALRVNRRRGGQAKNGAPPHLPPPLVCFRRTETAVAPQSAPLPLSHGAPSSALLRHRPLSAVSLGHGPTITTECGVGKVLPLPPPLSPPSPPSHNARRCGRRWLICKTVVETATS